MNIEQKRFLLFKANNGDIYLNCDEWRGTRHIHCAIVLDEITAKRIALMMNDSEAAVEREFAKASK